MKYHVVRTNPGSSTIFLLVLRRRLLILMERKSTVHSIFADCRFYCRRCFLFVWHHITIQEITCGTLFSCSKKSHQRICFHAEETPGDVGSLWWDPVQCYFWTRWISSSQQSESHSGFEGVELKNPEKQTNKQKNKSIRCFLLWHFCMKLSSSEYILNISPVWDILKSHQSNVKGMCVGLDLRSQKHGNVCWRGIWLVI